MTSDQHHSQGAEKRGTGTAPLTRHSRACKLTSTTVKASIVAELGHLDRWQSRSHYAQVAAQTELEAAFLPPRILGLWPDCLPGAASHCPSCLLGHLGQRPCPSSAPHLPVCLVCLSKVTGVTAVPSFGCCLQRLRCLWRTAAVCSQQHAALQGAEPAAAVGWGLLQHVLLSLGCCQ